MKLITKALVFGFVMVLGANYALAEGAGSPKELASKVKEAVASKDSKTISALYNWEGVAPDIEKQLKEAIAGMVEEPALKAEVRPLPQDFAQVQEMDGKQYTQNLKVEGLITLIYTEDGSATATMPFGAKDGKYFLTAPIVK